MHQLCFSYTSVLHQLHSPASVTHQSLISCASVTHQSHIGHSSVVHQSCISCASVTHQSCISHTVLHQSQSVMHQSLMSCASVTHQSQISDCKAVQPVRSDGVVNWREKSRHYKQHKNWSPRNYWATCSKGSGSKSSFSLGRHTYCPNAFLAVFIFLFVFCGCLFYPLYEKDTDSTSPRFRTGATTTTHHHHTNCLHPNKPCTLTELPPAEIVREIWRRGWDAGRRACWPDRWLRLLSPVSPPAGQTCPWPPEWSWRFQSSPSGTAPAHGQKETTYH